MWDSTNKDGIANLANFLRCGKRRMRTEKISCRLNSPAGSPGSCKGPSNELLSRHPVVSERSNKSFLLWETTGENQTLCCYCLACLDEWVIILSRQTYFSIVITGHFSQSVCPSLWHFPAILNVLRRDVCPCYFLIGNSSLGTPESCFSPKFLAMLARRSP